MADDVIESKPEALGELDGIEADLVNARSVGEVLAAQHRLGTAASASTLNSATVGNRIAALLSIAQQRLNEEMLKEAEEAKAAGNYTRQFSGDFTSTMFGFMSDEEKSYFQKLDARHQDDFLRIKYHTLNEEQKKQLPEEDRKKAEDLGELKTSLTEMEKHKTEEIKKDVEEGKITEHEAEEKIGKNKERFRKAHERVKEVEAEKQKAEKAPEALKPAAEAMVKEKKKKLGETLQKEVIDGALTEKDETRAERTQEKTPSQRFAVSNDVAFENTRGGIAEEVTKGPSRGVGIGVA